MKKLTGNQSKLDLNKNGKLDSNDFKMLRSKKGNGGGTGVSSETGYAVGTNSDLLMNQDYLAYKKGGGVDDKIYFVVAESTGNRGPYIFNAYFYETEAEAIDVMNHIIEAKSTISKNLPKDVLFDTIKIMSRPSSYRNLYANGGSLADTPESFPSTDAMSYGDGGSTSGWCYSIGGL